MGCISLKRVNIGSEFIIGIGEYAFADCPLLKEVYIGKNVEKVSNTSFNATFAGSSSLERFVVDKQNEKYVSLYGVLYEKSDEGLILLQFPANAVLCDVDGNPVDSDGSILAGEDEKIAVTEFRLPDEFGLPEPYGEYNIVRISNFAFQGSSAFLTVVLNPSKQMVVGDYAFANSRIQNIYIGEKVVSLGNIRGEGEYSVFSNAVYLNNIDVAGENPYYSSYAGVLFDKSVRTLIKYPASRMGMQYDIPKSVQFIASMAFKDNGNIKAVTISSYVSSIGLEAFYNCTRLAVVFFNNVYAPTAIMENAFSTNNPSCTTMIGCSESKLFDGEYSNEYGWTNYNSSYYIQPMSELPDVSDTHGNGAYAIVLVNENGERLTNYLDSQGNPNFIVQLTDPNGKTETSYVGKDANGLGDGIAVFYDMYGEIGLGFSIVYDSPYELTIYDTLGLYYAFTNTNFYLDYELNISYITLPTKSPDALFENVSIYGLTLEETDINTQTALINKAEYGTEYDGIELINPNKGYTEDNVRFTGAHSEKVSVSFVGYYNSKALSVVWEQSGLYQNGKPIPGCTLKSETKMVNGEIVKDTSGSIVYGEGSVTFFYDVPVDQLIPETFVEARLVLCLTSSDGVVYGTVKKFLNIDVIDFSVDENDVNLDSADLNVDLSRSNSIITALLGSTQWSFNLGKNLSLSFDIEGTQATISINASYNKKAGDYGTSYEAGYKANHEAHNKNTWFFQRKLPIVDRSGILHNYTMNIRFARGSAEFGYCYYRCYIYEGAYNNQKVLFYGAVRGLNGRSAYKVKADFIYLAYAAKAIAQGDITKGYQYRETIINPVEKMQPSVSNKVSFGVTLYGDIVLQYQKGKGIIPVSSKIKGTIKFTFEHERQFFVWFIPIYLQIQVSLGGSMDISIKYDEWEKVSIEEAQLVVDASLKIKAGIGCSILSFGVYGTIGTVFVLNFAPTFGIEKWTISGKIALYATLFTLKFKRTTWWPYIYYPVIEPYNVEHTLYQGDWTIIDNTAQSSPPQNVIESSIYIADNYEPADPGSFEEKAVLFRYNGKICKLHFVNMLDSVVNENDGQQYDNYNYRKLAMSEWNESSNSWTNQRIIDNNGRNDLAFSLYEAEGKVYVVYTQQGQQVDDALASDVYNYLSDVSIKSACLNSTEDVSTIVAGGDYKSLADINTVNGKLTVVWAENADNNMFGVSPDNYVRIDEENDISESHTFTTTANSVWVSQYENGFWSQAICIDSGLSAITDLCLNDAGIVGYIIDENGDLTDSNDRVLKYYNIVDKLGGYVESDSGILSVDSVSGGFYCYYDGIDGGIKLLTFDDSAVSSDFIVNADELTNGYKLLNDPEGNLTAVLYYDNVNIIENNAKGNGSAVFGIFKDGDVWGKPIRLDLDELKPMIDCYINNFDVVWDNDYYDSIRIVAEYVNESGVVVNNVIVKYNLSSALSLNEKYYVDINNKTITLEIVNTGAIKTGAYAVINGNNRVELFADGHSGETKTCLLNLANYGINPSVELFNLITEERFAIIDVSFNSSDILAVCKQLMLGDKNVLLVGVKNEGNLSASGKLYVAVGKHNEEQIKEYVNVVSSEFLDLGAGNIKYFEIELSNKLKINENTIFTMLVEDSDRTEISSCKENNLTYFTLISCPRQFSARVLFPNSPEKGGTITFFYTNLILLH